MSEDPIELLRNSLRTLRNSPDHIREETLFDVPAIDPGNADHRSAAPLRCASMLLYRAFLKLSTTQPKPDPAPTPEPKQPATPRKLGALRIGHLTYKLKWRKRPAQDGQSLFGSINYPKQIITLAKALKTKPERADEVLLHEVLHGLSHAHVLNLDEDTCNSLSVALTDFFQQHENITLFTTFGSR